MEDTIKYTSCEIPALFSESNNWFLCCIKMYTNFQKTVSISGYMIFTNDADLCKLNTFNLVVFQENIDMSPHLTNNYKSTCYTSIVVFVFVCSLDKVKYVMCLFLYNKWKFI